VTGADGGDWAPAEKAKNAGRGRLRAVPATDTAWWAALGQWEGQARVGEAESARGNHAALIPCRVSFRDRPLGGAEAQRPQTRPNLLEPSAGRWWAPIPTAKLHSPPHHPAGGADDDQADAIMGQSEPRGQGQPAILLRGGWGGGRGVSKVVEQKRVGLCALWTTRHKRRDTALFRPGTRLAQR
jgi:hypothetical protein